MNQLKETEINNLILDNITADEKFKIICRVKNFDIQEIAEEIYNIIDNNDYEYKDDYIGICGYEDESMEIEDKYYVDIDDNLLDTQDDWIKSHIEAYDITYEEAEQLDWFSYIIEDKFNNRQKEFIKLAIQCNIKRIILI